ncbi:hypothetical protein E4U53_007647, partial [Claviceps sorghi]
TRAYYPVHEIEMLCESPATNRTIELDQYHQPPMAIYPPKAMHSTAKVVFSHPLGIFSRKKERNHQISASNSLLLHGRHG